MLGAYHIITAKVFTSVAILERGVLVADWVVCYYLGIV
jgi:hypothetical protein